MFRPRFRLLSSAICLSLVLPGTAQSSTPQPQAATPEASSQALTLRTFTRMVNLDVVIEDKAGHHVTGLKAGDFRIFEQTPAKSHAKREQKIAAIREIHTAALKAPAVLPANPEPGVYTNAAAVAPQEDPVPPTVLVVDGVNTELQYQAQVHMQMLKILRQLPPNVPVAVLLMGTQLSLLQGFTTDPKVLQQALSKAESVSGQGLGHLPPQDDPDAAGNQLYGFGGSLAGGDIAGVSSAVQGLDQKFYEWEIELRIIRTCDAFISIAQSLAGYPGRKNLLWLSTSFPVEQFVPWAPRNTPHPGFDNNQNIPRHMQILNNALSAAKVAVYPVDIAGVTTLQVFSAAARPPNSYAGESTTADAARIAGAASRQVMQQNSEQVTSEDFAEGTGGKVCTGTNEIADCIRRAVADSSDFYEISYYPDSPDWNGEYRTVLVEAKERGAHLSYRRGYYATPEGSSDPHAQAAEMREHCDDLLDATAIAFTARSLPADSPDQLKFSLLIDASALSLTAAADGSHQVDVAVGVCTYDAKGSAVNLMNYPANIKLGPQQLETVNATGKLTNTIRVPGPRPAAVRLLVKDVPTGRLGSIYIKTADAVAAARTGSATEKQQMSP